MDPRRWTIGPIVFGQNYSRGATLHPLPNGQGQWYFDIPQYPGSAHYVTTHYGSLASKRRIILRYRVESDPDVRISPVTAPDSPSIVTIYFQRRGDNWSGAGPFEGYRWYATFASQMPISPGFHRIIAPLDGNWTAVETSSARSNPSAFAAAIADSDEVGFVLGGGTGYGHGIYAVGAARIVIEEFRIE